MIDPKVVELSIYNDIPHDNAGSNRYEKKPPTHYAGRWEMERRYLLVSHLQVRNIARRL